MKKLTLKCRDFSWWKTLGVVSLVVLLTILFWSHNYGDLLVTTRHGINFWNILFDGQIHNFFHLNITESGNVHYTSAVACVYNILIYIVFAVWNIPLAILWKITSIDVMNNVLCLAWAKLLPVTAAMVCAKLVWVILEDLNVSRERRRLAVYLMLSSAILLGSVFINSQYDTLGLVFQLLGLRCYLKKDNKGFLFYFGIAVCFKLFALLIVIPLLLLREKKLSRLVGLLFLLMVPTLITTLPFSILDAFRGIARGESIAISLFYMLFSKISQNGIFYWFIIAYGTLMIWCYLHNPLEISVADILWTSFCSICSFFVFLHPHPYWTVLMVPYIVLILALIPNHLMPVMLLLETIGSCALLITLMVSFPWTYWGNTMQTMLLPHLFSQRSETTSQLYRMIIAMDAYFMLITSSCMVLAFSAIAFLSFPGKAKYEKGLLVLDQEIMVVRFLAIAVVTLISILTMFL